MEPTWQPPESWLKEGYAYSAVTHLKTGAWTTILTAKESGGTHGAQAADVIIKMFSVPPGVHEDAQRIAKERKKFLDSAYLQKSLTEAGPNGNARGWVKIFKISEDPEHPSFTMEKCGPSIEDLFEHRVNMAAKDMYALVHAAIDSLHELMTRAKRSHGNLKISDVLSGLPGQAPPYKLADPSAKGEDHSANDLYSLGCILYKLIEHKDWDPMTQILPTSHWDRFKVRRDRWIQFCNLLLSPNGCHESLPAVKKEAYRLKPVSSLRPVYIGLAGLALVAAGAGGYHVLMGKATFKQPVASTQTTVDPAIRMSSAEIDPKVKAAFEAATENYKTIRGKWLAITPTPRYDHTQSRKLALASRSLLPDQIILTDANSYVNATDYYGKAAAKLQEALDQMSVEEAAGQKQDSTVLADFQNAQKDYTTAKTAWDAAAAKFATGTDHTRSKAIADAAALTKLPTPSDLAGFHSAADQYRTAAGKINEAIAMIPDEEKTALDQMDAHAAFDNAKKHYQELKGKWEALPAQAGLDLTQANAAADAAKKILPDQFVLTDSASYRTAAGQFESASQKMDQAFSLVEKAKKNFVAQESDVSTAVAKANQALKAKKYPQAFNYYKQAADMGNPPAMCNVGLFYEVGQGTEKDYTQAAAWYRKAADQHYAPAMVDLAFLYRTGKGVEKDFGTAFGWYKKAADAGNAEAMVELASIYENGEGVDRDYDLALTWYKKAAAQNNAVAMTNIGVFYEKGRGVPIDYAAAMQWYQKSAALNNAAAINDIGALYDNGHGVSTDYVQAMEWYKKSAAMNYAPAMCNVGTLYDNGQGTSVDHVEAMKWFRKAADLGHGMAMYNVGVLYETGRGVSTDMPGALTWYRKAARSNDPAAQQLATERLDRLGYSH